jgi:hemoglobin
MQTVYEAAGGIDGLRRLAAAWHARVMADEEVSHAFSHGYRPDHTERPAAYWAQALTDAGLSGDGRLRQVLHDYFAWATTTSMARYHRSAADVPAGLPIPHWSWDGLAAGNGPAGGA